MSTITDVTVVTVPVANQDDGVAFFTEKLGFEIRRDARIGATSRWVTVAAPGAAVEISVQQDSDNVGRDTGIRFGTTDAQSEHQRLAQVGVKVDEILCWPGVPPMFKFHDADANTYTMIEKS